MSETNEINLEDVCAAQIGDGTTQNNYFGVSYPQGIVANAIEKELFELKATRFFVGKIKPTDRAKSFSHRLLKGEFAGASDEIRSIALAWCARILAYTDLPSAKEAFEESEKLSSTDEVLVAKAFIASAEQDKSSSLAILSDINTSLSTTASFLVVVHHGDPAAGFQWMKDAGSSFSDLDSDGKYLFISYLLESGSWDEALSCIANIGDDDFKNTPVLHYNVAQVYLALAAPAEIRKTLLRHLPIDAHIRLSDDADSMEKRRLAIASFLSCSKAASHFDCDRAANVALDYHLWLKLRDSEYYPDALEELKGSLGDSSHRIRRVPLALQYGIKIDLKQLEHEIQQNIVRSGSVSIEVAMARLALAFEQGSPKDISLYIEQYKDQLYQFIDRSYIDSIQIEALAKSGDIDGASSRLAESEFPEDQKLKLENIIAESSGEDPVGKFREQFERTKELSDLVHLVKILEDVSDWQQALHYSLELFKRTTSLKDAKSAAFSMFNSHQFSDVLSFLEDKSDFVEKSDRLRALKADCYYREGKFSESKKEYEAIKDGAIRSSYKDLWVNISISSGDWESLHSYIGEEWDARESRDSNSLIRLAQLARSIDSPRTKQFVELATSKGDNNPGIFMAAYAISVGSGWEDMDVAGQWLNKAIELSSENGPIQRMSLAELMDRKPAWDEKEDDVFSRLRNGEIPLFMAANALNKSLCETQLLQVLANLREKDVRRRAVLPTYGGERGSVLGLESVKRIALDATSLLTLGFLGVPSNIASCFEHIVVPHSTLGWLFQERQEVVYHQPSRIDNAKDIQRLVQNGGMQELISSTTTDQKLRSEIGEDLACMISTARDRNLNSAEKAHIVVRSFPVHRVGSLMEEHADLSNYDDLMSSCSLIVEKLRLMGHIKASEESRAKDHLSLHETDWPTRVDIPDGAVLYLDDLSVTYFQYLGVLEVLSEADFDVVVSSSTLSDARNLINFENLTKRAEEVIESLREFLQQGISSGKILVGAQGAPEADADSELLHHPAFSAMHLLNDVDALVVDDRYFNKNLGGKILTTQELIVFLESKGKISKQDCYEAKATLRNSGYLLVPLDEAELKSALFDSPIIEGKLIESAELKAIRENFLKVQMSGYLQLPREGFWLANITRLITDLLRQQWVSDIDDSVARARSEWLVGFMDTRGWAGSFDFETGKKYAEEGFVHQVMALLIAPPRAKKGDQKRYFEWIEECFLPQIIDDGEMFGLVIEDAKKMVLNLVTHQHELVE